MSQGGEAATKRRQRRRLPRPVDSLPLTLWAGDDFVKPIVEAQARGEVFYGACMTSLNPKDLTHDGTTVTRGFLAERSEVGVDGGLSRFARVFAGVGEGASARMERATQQKRRKQAAGGGGGGEEEENEARRGGGGEPPDDDDDAYDDIPIGQLQSRRDRSATPAGGGSNHDNNGNNGNNGGGGGVHDIPYTAHDAALLFASRKLGLQFDRIAEVLGPGRDARSVHEFWRAALETRGGVVEEPDTVPWFTAMEIETMNMHKAHAADESQLRQALEHIAAALNLVPKPITAAAAAAAVPKRRGPGRPKKEEAAAMAAAADAAAAAAASSVKRTAADVEVYYRLIGHLRTRSDAAGVSSQPPMQQSPQQQRQLVRFEPWEREVVSRMRSSGFGWDEIMKACPGRTKMSLETLWYKKLKFAKKPAGAENKHNNS